MRKSLLLLLALSLCAKDAMHASGQKMMAGEVTLVTSDDGDTIAMIQQHAKRAMEEMEKLRPKSGLGVAPLSVEIPQTAQQFDLPVRQRRVTAAQQ